MSNSVTKRPCQRPQTGLRGENDREQTKEVELSGKNLPGCTRKLRTRTKHESKAAVSQETPSHTRGRSNKDLKETVKPRFLLSASLLKRSGGSPGAEPPPAPALWGVLSGRRWLIPGHAVVSGLFEQILLRTGPCEREGRAHLRPGHSRTARVTSVFRLHRQGWI